MSAMRLVGAAGVLPIPGTQSGALSELIADWAVTRFVLLAGKLGVFDALRTESLNLPELAERLSLRNEELYNLLETLRWHEYVQWKKGRYRLHKKGARLIELAGEASFADIARFLVDHWWREARWEESICGAADTPGPRPTWLQQPDAMRGYATTWGRLLAPAAQEVAERITLPAHAKRLLELGNGQGVFASVFCKAASRLLATVFSPSEAMADAVRETLARAALTERISVRAAHYLEDPLGDQYDVMLLCDVLQRLSAEESLFLLRAVWDALDPDGTVIVVNCLGEGTEEPEVGAFAAQTVTLTRPASAAAAHSSKTVQTWLAQVGFSNPQQKDLRRMPGWSVLSATKSVFAQAVNDRLKQLIGESAGDPS